MESERELEEFRALSLILQHRVLMTGLEAIDAVLVSCQSSRTADRETATLLLPALQSFTHTLPTHFAAEARSLAALLRAGADPKLGSALQQLDDEHPSLLARFQASIDRLTESAGGSGESPWPAAFERTMSELMMTMGAFRRHEAEEDALFAG
jgi:hypothetical protein